MTASAASTSPPSGVVEALDAARAALICEIDTLNRQIEPLLAALPATLELLAANPGRLVISGIGKSGHIGAKIAATLASTGTLSFFVHSTEALHGDAGMVAPGDVVLLISNSGRTAEVLRFADVLKHRGIAMIAVTKDPSSPLARAADVVIPLAVEREADPLDLAPTASTTATVAIGDALAAALMQLRHFSREQFAVFHVSGSLGSALDADQLVAGGDDD